MGTEPGSAQGAHGNGSGRDPWEVPWTLRDLFLSFLAAAVLILAAALLAGLVGGALSVVFDLEWQDDAANHMSSAQLAVVGSLVYGSLFLSAWFFAVKRRRASLRSAGFRPVSARVLVATIPLTIGTMILTGTVVALTSHFLGDVPDARERVFGDATLVSTGDLLWLLLLIGLAAPIVEEFFFRGLLFSYLRSKGNVRVAAGGSALVFAVSHGVLLLIPSLFVFGFILARLTERHGSLYPAIAMHMLNNTIVVLLIYAAT